MAMSAQPSNPPRSPSSSSREAPAAVQFHRLVPVLLSGVAGMVDVIGFLMLGLFTAHVTGNLVVIAALLVRGGPPKMAQILAVPVFIVAVGEHNDEVLKELGFELAADGFKRGE